MREQAKIMRQIGETVWLLISTRNVSDRDTPLDIVAVDAPPQTDTIVPIYAYVEWNTDEVSYDEAGHAKNLHATVTANVQYMHPMQACYAVKFSDGSVLEKTAEMLSDMRTSFAIHVSGMANIQE